MTRIAPASLPRRFRMNLRVTDEPLFSNLFFRGRVKPNGHKKVQKMTSKWVAKLIFSAKGRHQFRPLFTTLYPFLSPRDPSQKWCQKLASQRRAQSASTCCQLSENDLHNGSPVAAILTHSVHKWPPSGTGCSQERLREDQGTPR